MVSDRFQSTPTGISRNALIAGGVVLFHIAALWAMQTGLLRRAAEVVLPEVIMTEFIDPPKPVEPPPPPPPAPPQPKREIIKAPPPPRPLAIRDPKPAPAAPVGVVEPQPPAPAVSPPAPPAPPAPAPAPPAPPAVQLPSTDADYAQSCRPVYPSMSKRLSEQGRVVVKVVVGADGSPKQVEIKKSSGFDRLDEAAREAMLRCRFVPGKVNGVAQSMAYDAPVNFVLNNN
ncbi:MAG: energy transducer TonB [Proteobacteria bacterium]|nr:energy transducer TonB [Pseudomonadota bacterium]